MWSQPMFRLDCQPLNLLYILCQITRGCCDFRISNILSFTFLTLQSSLVFAECKKCVFVDWGDTDILNQNPNPCSAWFRCFSALACLIQIKLPIQNMIKFSRGLSITPSFQLGVLNRETSITCTTVGYEGHGWRALQHIQWCFTAKVLIKGGKPSSTNSPLVFNIVNVVPWAE